PPLDCRREPSDGVVARSPDRATRADRRSPRTRATPEGFRETFRRRTWHGQATVPQRPRRRCPWIADVDHLSALLLGCLPDQLLAAPPGWPPPVRGLGRLVTLLEPLLRRFLPERLGGVVLLLTVAGTAGGTAWLALIVAGAVHPLARLTLAPLLVY